MAGYAISAREANQLANYTQTLQSQNTSLKKRAKEAQLGSALTFLGEAALGGLAVGALRGRMEDATGYWGFKVGNAQIDAEAAIAVGLSVAGLASTFSAKASKYIKPQYQKHFLGVGAGVVGHYLGQVARKSVKTGQFSLVAGSDVGRLPMNEPQYVGSLANILAGTP